MDAIANASSVRLMLGMPGLENTGGVLRVVPHIINASDVPVSDLAITDITLGSAIRNDLPSGVPAMLGTLPAGGTARTLATFPAAGLQAGARYLLNVRGSYRMLGLPFGLALNRYVEIPIELPSVTPMFKAHVTSGAMANYWNYAVHNDEAAGSPFHIACFGLALATPVQVTGTPPGWEVETDNISYVLWQAADFVLPYPHQVAPGQSLAGFQLASQHTTSEAGSATLAAWDHVEDSSGPVVASLTQTPHR